ncbi:iron-containing alcohol dehydrogenase [Lentisphaerota bacterium ZTH]|nr:iron-containing alcohol dehydrogenase [Lentisphaerota bacterium]WET05381.1 iron-containing alcohol dehydrogenase [Lentisphaerota bacterium ZTH]
MSNYQEILDTYPDTTFVFGSGAWEQLELLLRDLGARKVAVFTGRNSADKTGAWSHLLKALDLLDLKIVRYKDIEAEPCIETIGRMTEFLLKEKPDEVIALGGGSPMDAAKAAYLEYQTGGNVNDFFGVNQYTKKHRGEKLKKVICLPMTSGTGSEATPYSNIVDKKLKVKKLIVEPQIIPEYSFVIPELAASMPATVTRATGCDALAHSLEGFLNIRQDHNHPKANEWAFESIRLIKEFLPRAIKDGSDLEARAAVSAAATLGGMVIRFKSTGLPHLCSFSWFGRIEHGLAVTLLLPSCWDYYITSDGVRERTMQLKDIFPGDSPEEIVASYRAFLEQCGVPKGLKHFADITPELLELTAESAGQNKMKLELAPKPVPLKQSKEILLDILTRAYNE